MRAQRLSTRLRIGTALALVLSSLLGACTKGGQFDPTELLNNDMFDTKKKLAGQREAVFPGGVPGTSAGVPQDLVKGYQAPPDQTDADAAAPLPAPGGASPADATTNKAHGAATAEAKPKPKPKPKIARAPAPQPASAPGQDPIWGNNQSAAPAGPTRISVGAKPAAPPQDQGAAAQPAGPTPAQRVQTDWPSSPSGAPAQQTAQPSQSVWPSPPAATQ
jgi:hypothetical protein